MWYNAGRKGWGKMKQKWIKYSNFFMLLFFTIGNVYALEEVEEKKDAIKQCLADGTCINCGGDIIEIPMAAIKILNNAYDLLKFGTPVILIFMGAYDLGRAILGSNDDDIKKKQNKFIKRLIAAAMVFLVFAVVEFVVYGLTNFGLMDENGCMNSILNGK